MKFRFRLEKAAQFYAQRETAKKLELANVIAQLAKLTDELKKIEIENQEVISQNNRIQTIAAPWIQVWMSRIDANLASIKQVQKEVEKVMEALEVKKIELAAISKRKKALEKVREKKLAEFRVQKARNEQKQLDENYQILEFKRE